MTLTADRRNRVAAPSARPARTRPVPDERSLAATLALPDVYRATDDDQVVVGYVQLAGPVYVALLGSVYNTSVEVAQCLDLTTALDRLRAAHSTRPGE